MYFNNNKQLFFIRLKQFFFTLIGVITIILTLFINGFPEGKEWIIYGPLYGAIIIFLVTYLFLDYYRKYYFIYFSELPESFVIRYYSNNILEDSKNAFEVPKEKYAGYEIQRKNRGLRKYLIIKQKTEKGIGRYPAISISALSANQIEKLIRSLERNIKR